ncbi:MAG: DUF5053 domain-containing protein [Dysgonamonadaceae bacterium]|nr:DUF5053 domain-containing protein [Dysgonamonadaceae bacterium]
MQEIEKLKKEFVLLNTEEERKLFDIKFRKLIASKNESEKKAFADAFAASAKKQAAHTKEMINEMTIRIKLEKVLGVVSMSYIAREYFHKSKGWFSQKLNGNIKNGKITFFTESELIALAKALEDISNTIRDTARLIA